LVFKLSVQSVRQLQ